MDIRYAIHPEHAENMNTEALRENFLIKNLFRGSDFNMTYTFDDRLVVGGISPDKPTPLYIDPKIMGSNFFLERREMGVINIGGPGSVSIDGEEFSMAGKDGLYIGMGAKDLVFASNAPNDPALFYINSAPAHKSFPTRLISVEDAAPVVLGDGATSNHRTIRKYIHPDGAKSCQLVMGMTSLEPGSIWNTMPVHTHGRRMEAYFYFNLPEDQVVFHFMGKPSQTRHIVVRSRQAVLSPSWSIHSGAGTASYTFIWGMAGENQTFDDMDGVPMSVLK